MLRKKAEPLGAMLREFLRQQGLETPLCELRAVEAWEQIAPPGIKRYVRDVKVRNANLYIQLSNPALRANMMMARAELVRQINARVGAQAIENILFC